VLRVAAAAHKTKNGIYNDALAVVADANHDGRINAVDVKAYGVASNIAVVPFEIRDRRLRTRRVTGIPPLPVGSLDALAPVPRASCPEGWWQRFRRVRSSRRARPRVRGAIRFPACGTRC
jgi:hypothetical protein